MQTKVFCLVSKYTAAGTRRKPNYKCLLLHSESVNESFDIQPTYIRYWQVNNPCPLGIG